MSSEQVSTEDPQQGSQLSPRKTQVLEHIRAAASSADGPVLLDVQQRLPKDFPQPDAPTVRLFHLSIQDHCWRSITKLLAQYPTIVLHHHFDETPLICAIRCGWEDIALYLVQHGASVHCAKMLFDCRHGDKGASYDWYEVSAREMAYEKRMLELLEILDYLTGNYFAYLKPPDIAIRMLRPQKFPDLFEDVFELPIDFFTDSYLKPPDKISRGPRRKRTVATKQVSKEDQARTDLVGNVRLSRSEKRSSKGNSDSSNIIAKPSVV